METKETIKRPDAILTADIHLREDTPICRVDDFQAALWRKMDYITELSSFWDIPVLHSGDLFHHWKPSPNLLTLAFNHLPHKFLTVYGNHDLPQHNLDLKNMSGVYTLSEAGRIEVVEGGHWGVEPVEEPLVINGRKILLIHIMTYKSKPPYPGCLSPKGNALLKKYPIYDLVVSGDNHTPFTETYKGRLLVNPGSVSRQEAGQIDFRPRVYLYYAETNTVKKHYLPINKEGVVDVISREHLDSTTERDDRILAFISKLKSDTTHSISFEENMQRMLEKNKIRKSVKNIINQAMDS